MKKLFEVLFAQYLNPRFTAFGPSKRSVDGALVHFRRAMDELRLVEEQEAAEAARQDQIANDALVARDVALKQADRAKTVFSKIENLVTQ